MVTIIIPPWGGGTMPVQWSVPDGTTLDDIMANPVKYGLPVDYGNVMDKTVVTDYTGYKVMALPPVGSGTTGVEVQVPSGATYEQVMEDPAKYGLAWYVNAAKVGSGSPVNTGEDESSSGILSNFTFSPTNSDGSINWVFWAIVGMGGLIAFKFMGSK
jgi:hypothetical protein